MKMKKNHIFAVLALLAVPLLMGAQGDCSGTPTAQQRENQMQATLQGEAVASVGVPAIYNFREKRLLKTIFELRDQEGLITYTYLYSPMTGKLQKFCDSIGYGIPYATQFTAPERVASPQEVNYQGNITIPQPDPNGLFSPANAEGTWVMCKDPNGKSTQPVYIEPRVVVSPFPLALDGVR